MTQYFLNYIRSGDPNGAGLPEWKAAGETPQVMELGTDVGMTDAPYQELYAILREMGK